MPVSPCPKPVCFLFSVQFDSLGGLNCFLLFCLHGRIPLLSDFTAAIAIFCGSTFLFVLWPTFSESSLVQSTFLAFYFTPLFYCTTVHFCGICCKTLSLNFHQMRTTEGSTCCWYTEASASNATNVSFGTDGAKSPHLFTRGCTPGVGVKLLKTLWIRIFSRRRKSYQESKGVIIWLPFHQ